MNGTTLHRIVIQHLDGARKGESDAFVQSAITVGRASDCDLIFSAEKSTSSHHAVLRQRNEVVEIIDTQSINGTFVNELRVERAVLKDGDLVRFGVLGPIVKIGLSPAMEGSTAHIKSLATVETAGDKDSSAPQTETLATQQLGQPVTRNWRFVRNTAVLYAGGAIAALGAFNTIVDRYQLDVRWFTTFLIFTAGGFVSTILEAWYRGTPGAQKIQWWELATHAFALSTCLTLSFLIWR
jgi:pSer/pThr/pTyr-binding forkhead associated (FHA) protein